MYLPDSKVRDPRTGEWLPEPIQNQVIEISHDADVMEYRVRIDHDDDLSLFMRYTCRYGAEEWVPYGVYHIEGDPNHPKLQPNDHRKVVAQAGEPIAYIKQVYVDPRTRFRITKHSDGAAQYVLMSRLSEDRQRMVGKLLPAEGNAEIDKHFVREAGAGPEWP
jgi:hypothetical protein